MPSDPCLLSDLAPLIILIALNSPGLDKDRVAIDFCKNFPPKRCVSSDMVDRLVVFLLT